MFGKINGKAPMATCPVDGEPLVGTFEFPGYEFICVPCGRKYGFLSPRGAESTDKIEARQKELQKQYDAERAARKAAAS